MPDSTFEIDVHRFHVRGFRLREWNVDGHDRIRAVRAVLDSKYAWNVMFNATKSDRQTCLFLHCRDYDEARAVAQKCAVAIVEAGTCTECSHDHVGVCSHVMENDGGMATHCRCAHYPPHNLNHEWLDGGGSDVG